MIRTEKSNVMGQIVPALPAIYINYKLLEMLNRFTLPKTYGLKLNCRHLALYLKIKKRLAKVIVLKCQSQDQKKKVGPRPTAIAK